MVDEIVSLNEQLRDVQRQNEHDREAMGGEKYNLSESWRRLE